MAERIQELDIESKEYANEMNKLRLAAAKKDQAIARKASKQRRALEVIETLKKVLDLEGGAGIPWDERKIVVNKLIEFIKSLKVQ